jgi:hypothetical protein
VFEIPSDTTDARLSWAREFEQEEPLYWALEFDPDSLANIEITSVDSPDTVEIHEPTEVEITLENSGGSDGTFRRTLTILPTENERSIEVSVPAGETVVHTEEIPQPTDFDGVVDSATFEIGGVQTQTQYVIPEREIGESYVTPGRMVIEVSEVLNSDYVEREGSFFTGPRTYESEESEQLILFNLSVENRDNRTRTPPSVGSFSVFRGDGSEADTSNAYPLTSSEYRFTDPVEADSYDGGDLSSNDSTDGWILIRVPADVDFSDATLRWQRDVFLQNSEEPEGLVAEWSLQ